MRVCCGVFFVGLRNVSDCQLRIVLISDTHGKHEELGTLSGDVLIHCGDFCDGFNNDGAHLASIDDWFLRQEFDQIYCVGGNHDFAAQERHANGIPVFENAIFLQDQKHVFGGITFYGTPWLPDLSGWAYYLPENKRRGKWSLIPNDVNILITHTPPFGILDSPRAGGNVGCSYLRSRVREIAPKLHCFGHVHASAGRLVEEKTTFVNASVIDSNYVVRHKPKVIDVER
jgi:Icc-related predicted phosphoesterase